MNIVISNKCNHIIHIKSIMNKMFNKSINTWKLLQKKNLFKLIRNWIVWIFKWKCANSATYGYKRKTKFFNSLNIELLVSLIMMMIMSNIDNNQNILRKFSTWSFKVELKILIKKKVKTLTIVTDNKKNQRIYKSTKKLSMINDYRAYNHHWFF